MTGTSDDSATDDVEELLESLDLRADVTGIAEDFQLEVGLDQEAVTVHPHQAVVDAGEPVRLPAAAIALGLGDALYTPEVAPFLLYYPEDDRLAFVFETGEVVGFGPDRDAAVAEAEQVCEALAASELLTDAETDLVTVASRDDVGPEPTETVDVRTPGRPDGPAATVTTPPPDVEDDRERVRTRLVEDLQALSDDGLLAPPVQGELEPVLDERWRNGNPLEHTDADPLVAGMVFDVLRRRGRAVSHDTECIYGVEESYGALVSTYAGGTNGHLEDLRYGIRGDPSEDDAFELTLALDGERVSASLRENSDWADTASLTDAFNVLLERATDAERRLVDPRYDVGQWKNLVFVHPDRVDRLREYFQSAFDGR